MSDIGPLGPVRGCAELFGAGPLPPPLLALEEGLVAGAGELSAWLVTGGV